jgi:sugar (pentulose or hexulose) kinase
LVDASPVPVSAVAMAAASGNTLLTDDNGEPLINIINWMDQRAVKRLPDVLADIKPEKIRQIVGWPCVDIFPLAHLAWLREHQTDLYRNAGHYCMNTDWLLFKLTGNWVMDHSTATTFHLQDQVAGSYYKPFLEMLDISEIKLSQLVVSGAVAGHITEATSHDTGLPVGAAVVAGCFDHPAAARSVGVIEPGQLMLSCGTSWVGFFPEMFRQRIVDAELLCDPFFSGHGGPWGAIFSVPMIGRTIDWYVDNVIAPGEMDKMRIFDESAAEALPGADGLIIDLNKKPEFIDADRKNISRAVMEGVVGLLKEKIKQLEPYGFKFNEAVMVGGPSKSPVWPEIVADITGLKLSVGSAHVGAKGAAMLARKGCLQND